MVRALGARHQHFFVGLASGLVSTAVLGLHLGNHVLSSTSHGEHGESNKDVWEHGTNEEPSNDKDVASKRNLHETSLVHECSQGRQGSEHSGSIGKALASGSGSVAHGIKQISLLTSFLALRANIVDHLGNTSGIVGDGTICITSHGDTKSREHANRSHGDGKASQHRVRDDDSDSHENQGDDCGQHALADTLDDDSSGGKTAGLRNCLSGRVVMRGVVLGNSGDQLAGEETASDGNKKAPGNRDGLSTFQRVIPTCSALLLDPGGANDIDGLFDVTNQNDSGDNSANQNQEDRDVDVAVHGLEEDLQCSVIRSVDVSITNDATQDADTCDVKRKLSAHFAEHLSAQHTGGDDATNEGLEQVGTHTGNVADVVSDGSRVTSVVLGDALDDLTDEISTDIGSLGVDTASDAGEPGDGGGTSAIPGENLDGAKGGVAESDSQYAQANDGLAHNSAATEGDEETSGEVISPAS